MFNGHNRAAIERAIHEQIDTRDEVTCAQFAEHAATWVEPELVLELCQALINYQAPNWLIDRISSHSAELGNALARLDSHIDRHRAEFIEEEAGNRLKAAEAAADARAETDAESRRLIR